MNKLASVLHEATHQVPGVPAHRENGPAKQLPSLQSNKHPRVQSPERQHQWPRHHQAPSRVLVAWQNWIGEHIGRRTH